MDAALVNLVVTLVLLVATFVFRKRLLSTLGRLLLAGSVKFARDTFLVEEVSKAPDGSRVARIGLSDAGKGLVAAVTPVLMAEIVKGFKFKPGVPGVALPEGIDLSNLSAALPALLNSGMVPKKYAGILAIAATLLQNFLGGGTGMKPGLGKASSSTEEIVGPGR